MFGISHRKSAGLVFLCMVLSIVCGAAFAEKASLASLLTGLQFNVITTEPQEKIADTLRPFNIKLNNFYTIDTYKGRAMQLNESNMLIIIDRQKAGEDMVLLERLMGIKVNEIGPSTVLVSVFRRAGTEEGYRILFTAPDEKSLYNEFNGIFNMPEIVQGFEDTGFNVVRRYSVVDIQVVADLDKEAVSTWIASITRAGGDVYDWKYVPASELSLEGAKPSTYVLLLNSALQTREAVRPLLSKDLSDWLASDGRFNQQAAMSYTAGAGDKKVQVYAFAAPGKRNILDLLTKYEDLAAVPDRLDTYSLRDFRYLNKVGLTIYRKNRSDQVLGAVLGSFNTSLKTALDSMNSGISLRQMQDEKAMQVWEGKLDAKVYDNMDGIATLEITDYQGPSAPSISAFAVPKPKPPVAPAKSDKAYAAKLKKYQAQQKDYTKKLAAWESQQKAYQQRLLSAAKQWVSQEYTLADCSISGIFRLYSNSGQGRTLLLQLPFYGSANRNDAKKPCISQAFTFACKDLAARLQRNSVFPADVATGK